MPITDEQLRNYRWSALDAVTSNTFEHISQTIASYLHNAHGFNADHLREVIADNSLADLFAAQYAACQSGYSPSGLRDNIASVPISTVSPSPTRESWLRKVREAQRKEELERIRLLIGSELVIRYNIEVK